MTTSTSNAQAGVQPRGDLAAAPLPPVPAVPPSAPPGAGATASARELPRTVWSRFIILLLCLAVVTTTLAFGTVHAWSLAAFQLSAALVLALWMLDAWRTRVLRVSLNPLQLPLLGLFAVGLVQLTASLTLDPQGTRLSLVELGG